jgi:hypothetical protein
VRGGGSALPYHDEERFARNRGDEIKWRLRGTGLEIACKALGLLILRTL